MNLSAPFIKRPVMTTILMAALLLFGVVAFFRLPVTDLPDVNYPIISIQAYYSGASPQVMANSVATPIEKELGNIQGVKLVNSQSSRGMMWLTLLFELDCDIDEAAHEVQAALKRAEAALPSDLDHPPSVHKAGSNGEGIIYLVLTSASTPLAELYEYAHTRIEQRIARVTGVGKVQVWGSPYAVRIQLNPELMAARGVTFDEVQGAVRGALGNIPLGVMETPGRKFTLDVPGQLKNATDFRHLLIAPHVYLKDVAEVADGLESEDIFHYITKEGDSLAVILEIQKQSGANAVSISQDLNRLIQELNAELPPAMQLKLWFDKAVWIKEAIDDVEWSLVIAFMLVIGVIYFSLRRLRETLVAAAALPLSIIGTLVVMQFLHFNLDILSLLALTLATGFVIDDAIVVLENIVRHQEKGLQPREAALQGSKQISFTVLSMTLSLVAVFLPLFFMKDMTGMLFREFSVTLAISIIVSGFVSLSLTPMLCSRFKASAHQPQVRAPSRFMRIYASSLQWCIGHKKTTFSFAVMCVVVTVFVARFLPVNLFPEEDRGFVWSVLQIPSSLAKADKEAYQNKLNQIVLGHPAVNNFVTLNFKDYFIHLIDLLPEGERPPQAAVIADLQGQFNAVPDTMAFLRGVQLLSAGGGNGLARNNYQFVLRGSDIEEVRVSGEALKQKLLANSSFVNPDITIKADDPKLEVFAFEDTADQLGLSRERIQMLLQNAYAGGSVGKIERGSEQYNVILELAPEFQKNTSALAKLYLKTNSGGAVPLKAVAHWQETVGLQNIEHIDLLPAATLFFDLSKETPLAEGLATLKQIAAETLPASVSGKLEGVADKIDSTAVDTILLLLLSVVAMYAVLAILYESFIHPLTILSALPFACLGGILTLLAFRETLSIFSMVGFLLLIGIVKKNGIMIVDYALELQRKENRSPEEAILEACKVRFRPIMMTTVAAVMGALPVAIGFGSGAETRRGLGLVIVGGLLFSQFLTLYITPIIYLFLEKLRPKKSSHLASVLEEGVMDHHP